MEKNREGPGRKYWNVPDIHKLFKLEVFLKTENNYYCLLITILQWLKAESENALQPSLVKVSLQQKDLDDVTVSKEEFEGFSNLKEVKKASIKDGMACLEIETNMVQFDITRYVSTYRKETVEFLREFGDSYDRYNGSETNKLPEKCIIFTGHDKRTRRKILDELEDRVKMWIDSLRTALEIVQQLYSCYRDQASGSPRNLRIKPWPNCSWVCLHSFLNALRKTDSLKIKLYEGLDKNKMYKIILVKKDGEFIKYWPNGNKKYRVIYLNGKKDGVEFEWFENGVLSFAATNKNGSCQAYISYNEKSEIEETYKA